MRRNHTECKGNLAFLLFAARNSPIFVTVCPHKPWQY